MSQNDRRPVVLIIVDGWSFSAEGEALAGAHTPCYDEIKSRYPAAALAASGSMIGLADGEAGDAEIGHRTIGAGRIVKTDSARVQEAIAAGDIERSRALQDAFRRASARGASIHLIGLLSDAGINSNQEALYSILRGARAAGLRDVFVHGILDGRDVNPRTADVYVDALEIKMADIGVGRIATLCGRFYGMDEGQNWERTARAFTMLVHGEGERTFDPMTAIRASFLRGISDEFIAPIVVERELNVPVATVRAGDLAIFFNHEPEPTRQLVRFLSVPDASAAKPAIETVCLVEYDPSFALPVILERARQSNVLPDVLEKNGITTCRISETSRTRHLSAFLNGRTDGAGDKGDNIFLDSLGLEKLEVGPESMSFKVADTALRQIESASTNFVIVNFPAAAEAAATGDLSRTVEAIQYVDTCLGGLVDKVKEMNGIAVVTSSHASLASTAPSSDQFVPFHVVDDEERAVGLAPTGSLRDVAPTLLGLFGMDPPAEMSGRDLRRPT